MRGNQIKMEYFNQKQSILSKAFTFSAKNSEEFNLPVPQLLSLFSFRIDPIFPCTRLEIKWFCMIFKYENLSNTVLCLIWGKNT